MLRFANAATPFTAAAVNVPDNVPPAGLVPIATVIDPVNPVTTLFEASSARPDGRSDRGARLSVAGLHREREMRRGGAVTLNAVLVAPVSPALLAARV